MQIGLWDERLRLERLSKLGDSLETAIDAKDSRIIFKHVFLDFDNIEVVADYTLHVGFATKTSQWRSAFLYKENHALDAWFKKSLWR